VFEQFAVIVRSVGAFLGLHAGAVADAMLPSLGALVVVTVVATVLVLVARTVGVVAERLTAVGARSRKHTVLLSLLPDASHPDARGHVRSRAPGSLLPIA
jgi:hypothetical protein